MTRAWQLMSAAALLLAAGSLFVAVLLVNQQKEGREFGIRVLCGAQQGTIDAGRSAITAGANIAPPRFERNLVLLGMKELEERKDDAEMAAVAYSLKIAQAVERAAGVKGSSVVDDDGTLDCERLVHDARAK